MNYYSIDCPTCDEVASLVAIPVNQDCDFDLVDSQICGLLIFPCGSTVPDWSDPSTWCDSIDNTSLTGGKYVVGEGGIPAPEKTIVQLPKKKEKVSKRKYTLTFSIKNLGDLMYDFLREIQCGNTCFTFFIETTGGRYFGSVTGIIPSSVDVDFPLGEGIDDVELATITLTWEGKTDPDRLTYENLNLSDCGQNEEDNYIPLWSTEDDAVWSTEDGDKWRVDE